MPQNQDDKKRERAARSIQRAYRNYLQRKQENVSKPDLTSQASSSTGGLFANIKNKETSITLKN